MLDLDAGTALCLPVVQPGPSILGLRVQIAVHWQPSLTIFPVLQDLNSVQL